MRLAGKVVAQALAHKLRGAAGNLALDEVSSRAADVESRLQAGNDAGPALDALRIALARALDSISRYAPVSAAGGAEDAPPMDAGQLGALLHQAVRAFNQDDPAAVEPVLAQLDALLSAAQMAPLRDAVESFDFRGGEAAAQALAETLGVSEER
ncbi:Hpt domain-containing protein [Chromobacterium violaceum]